MADVERLTWNDGLAFLVECAALLALGLWGWRTGPTTPTALALAVGAPAVAAVAWGRFAAPRSRNDVLALEVATKVVVLGWSLLAARTLLPEPWWWWGAAAVVVVNTSLTYLGPWSRRPRLPDTSA